MRTIDKLMYIEPTATVDVHAGTIHFTDRSGEEVTAEFYVRTVPDVVGVAEDSAVSSRRQDDYSQQYMEEITQLMGEGATDVSFKEAKPSPFF